MSECVSSSSCGNWLAGATKRDSAGNAPSPAAMKHNAETSVQIVHARSR